MKVQRTQQIKIQQQQPQFKGVADTTFRFLATNQGVGANLTDLGFMVVPRVATDAKRGPAACAETARREASGTCNHSLVGVYGTLGGAATAALMGMGKNYGIEANKILAAPETLNILAENKTRQIKNKTTQADYLKETLRNLKAFNPTAKNADAEGYVKLSDETVNEISKILDDALNNKEFKAWEDKNSVNSIKTAMNKIIADTGAESKYVLESVEKVIDKAENGKNAEVLKSETGLKTLLEDIFKVSDAFNKENVKKAFEDQVASGKEIAENTFIKKFSKFSKIKSATGFAVATGIGMSIQPMNIYLTKKKTGSDGFVGVEGRSKDNSAGFKAMKGAAATGFLGLTLATLGSTSFKDFMDKMAFKGFWPTIPQLKGIYGLTIISRLLATRDKDELREALTKDTLGFLSWLVLGDIVNKLTAEGLEKGFKLTESGADNTVMNRTKEVADKKNIFNRVFNSKLKTRDEVLVETLSKNGISTVKEDGVAKKFKEMLQDLDKIENKEVVKIAKKRLRTLNWAQAAGYAFSGLVLGLGIPNLNIYITNTLDKKRKAAKAAAEQQANAAA